MSARGSTRDLRRLSMLHGVQQAYYDASGDRKTATPESLVAVLHALGISIEHPGDASAALVARQREIWEQRVDPVLVDWSGSPSSLDLRLPQSMANEEIHCSLQFEDGLDRHWDFDLAQIESAQEMSVEGSDYVVKKLPIPDGLPWGYHRFRIAMDDGIAESLLISAPKHAFTGARGRNQRLWGAFLPLYAVHSDESMGTGTYSDLHTLVDWVRDLGGEMFGTLPLLPTFLNTPFEPSPYSPVSRRLWSEFFIDIEGVPEFDASATARAMLLTADMQRELEILRKSDLVEYEKAAALKRTLLTELSKTLLSEPTDRRAEFHAWAAENPLARDYARFMATADRHGKVWQEWPQKQRAGRIEDGDFDPDDAHYHLYVQWIAQAQIATISERSGAGGGGLYLDLPLGVHGGGFDAWSKREIFVDARVGAPPDNLNRNGQDWGFPPMHPDRAREDEYDYFRQCIRHHLRYAGALRVDHVMGLHRLYWIPEDASPRDGVYVRYHHEDFYAILSLESHRNQALIIGEDLGTVSSEVRSAMGRHRFQRMYVVPFQIAEDGEQVLNDVAPGSLATLNTHDLAPFAREWANMDDTTRERIVSYLHELGWLANPTDDPQAVVGALTRYLGDSPASMVLVNLEDLWLETEQQNVPGTVEEHPNWRRKARYDLDAFTRMPRVTDALRELDLLRKRGDRS
jgi:4-alpha-glucanotransferase